MMPRLSEAMNYFRSLIRISALAPSALAVLLVTCAGCDRDNADDDCPQPAVKEEHKVGSTITPTSPANCKAKTREQIEIEQLKQDIEELRRKLKSTQTPRQTATLDSRYGPNATIQIHPVTIAEGLARTRKRLDEINKSCVLLFRCSTEELVERRVMLGSANLRDLANDNWLPIEVRRLLLKRLNADMSRQEVHRILGVPDFSVGAADYYSRDCLPPGLEWAPLNFSISLTPPVYNWQPGSEYYRIRYRKGYFKDQMGSPRTSDDNPFKFDDYKYWGPSRF